MEEWVRKSAMLMRAADFVQLAFASALLLGCSTHQPNAVTNGTSPAPIAVTVPNGSSPASANAPRAPINDTEEMRRGWNHGNGALWVWLPPHGELSISEDRRQEDGFYRVKFGWWRGVRGRFTIGGRRLDAAAPPLRYLIHADSYGDLGFMPSYLDFPSEGLWQITGRIDDQSLTFVVHVVKTS